MSIAFEFYAIAGQDKTIRQFLKEYFAGYWHLLARLIERRIERRELCDIDAEATAITLVALSRDRHACFLWTLRQPGG